MLLIPRIDYEKVNKSEKTFVEESESTRPPPARFDLEKTRDRVKMQGYYYVFEGDLYDTLGFLHKDFEYESIVSHFFNFHCFIINIFAARLTCTNIITKDIIHLN